MGPEAKGFKMKLLKANDISRLPDNYWEGNLKVECFMCDDDAEWPHLYKVHGLTESLSEPMGVWVQKQRVLR
jgi:hypothetical protein